MMSILNNHNEKDRDHLGNSNDNDIEVIDDWGWSHDEHFHLFAQHEIRTVYMRRPLLRCNSSSSSSSSSPNDKSSLCASDDDNEALRSSSDIPPPPEAPLPTFHSFYISCVEALTPLDMIDLGDGIHDATCHCVWTGAFLFLTALSKPILYPYIICRHYHGTHPCDHTTDSSDTPSLIPDIIPTVCTTGTERRPIQVLELGCGTGIASIGLWAAFRHHHHNKGTDTDRTALPLVHITMTDADPEALKLCRTNCELNHIPSSHYDIDVLFWGTAIDSTSAVARGLPYDVVLATDVLYDITLLRPLLQTAHTLLVDQGIFLLAHVPRACYKSTHPAVSNLDEYIIPCATTTTMEHDDDHDGGFQFLRIIYPDECGDGDDNNNPFPKDALNSITISEMQEIGAAIFVFQKANQGTTTVAPEGSSTGWMD